MLKILSRKAINRDTASLAVATAVVAQLQRPATTRIAAEAANVVLNLCYESANVQLIIDAGGAAPLAALLGDQDAQVRFCFRMDICNVAGAGYYCTI